MTSSDTGGESRVLSPPENYDAEAAAASPASDYEEKTEVIYGEENVTNWALQLLSTVTKTLDLCGDRYGPSIIVANEQVIQKYIELHDRGVRQRLITEITRENIIHCKKLMKFQELRHLDGLKGYLSIADGRTLSSHAFGLEGKVLPHAVATTVRIFVEQQQYFFETLWNKAIPAKQRIREIEEGAKREFVETIRDPSEIQKIGFDLIKKAEEEILILFSTANAFRRQEKAGALELLKEAATLRGVKVRILVLIHNNTANERIQQMKDAAIDIRTIRPTFQNKLTTLVIDQSLCLTVELKDDTRETSDEAIGLATYSNSEATVFSYASIFENLWIQTQLHKRRQQQEEAAVS
jgi:two-component system sensor histidine kinase VicK